jgi:hypothetical protein
MVDVFGIKLKKEELLERISSMSQVAGARVFEYTEGKAAGVKAVEVNAGKGLSFTVLLDRGMDIGDAYYKGIPISWKSKVGVIAPTYFENQGHQWLRDFYGGLLTTCGLIQVGEPCEDEGVYHGLHGMISHTPAEKYWIDEYWEGDDYIIKVTGRMREAIIYDENLTLTREIKCIYGEKKLFVKDVVVNEGYNESPFMIMYHVNEPFPIVSEKSRFYSSALSVQPQQEWAGDYSSISGPVPGYRYETFVHTMPGDRDRVYYAVINEELKIGVYLGYDPKALPVGNEWKMLGQQDYVVAMEPSNTYNVGIAESRKQGWLPKLKPGEKSEINLEIGVLEGESEIEEFKKLL